MKKLLSIFLLCFCFSATAQNWDQLGQDINGVFIDDNFGNVISINDAGNIIAVGSMCTHVKVYEFDGINWVQLGQTLYTESCDAYATSISLNANGNILSLGIPYDSSNSNLSGCVKVFEFINNSWTQIGSSIYGAAPFDKLGISVSLDSIGSIMAVSGEDYITIYENINNTWIQVGNSIDISGSFFDKIALSSNGSRVVLLSTTNSKIITWDDNTSTWISNWVNFNLGNEFSYDHSLSISNDASIIAIGNPSAQASPQNPNSEGNALIYKWDGTSLIQLGEAILPDDTYEYSFGKSISLSNNGEIVAVGTHQNNLNGSWTGRVGIYEFTQNTWSKIGQSIYGSSGSRFGYSTAINGDGTTICIGATNGGQGPGFVRAYQSVTFGCMDSSAINYNSNADIDDGSCIESIFGCLNETYVEYNSYANLDDGSCEILLSDAYSELTQENINLNNTLDEATTSLSSLQQALDTWNTTIDLSAGWNMFGYGCPSSIDVAEGLSNHTESIIITKDNNGTVYYPEFDFNGIGDFTPGFGYQIKLTEAIEGFSLCDWYVNDIPEDNIVSLQEENADLNQQIKCLTNPEIGDFCHGGIIFYIDSNNEYGLVMAEEDVDGLYEWGCHNLTDNISFTNSIGLGYENSINISENNCLDLGELSAAEAALNFQSNSYNDWYLPSNKELITIYDSLDIISLGFENSYYWSSSPHSISEMAYCIQPILGYTANIQSTTNTFKVRPIRAFGNWTMGCMDETACNFNAEANMADNSCEFVEEGYYCDGTAYPQIGDEINGGIVFKVNIDGTGLVFADEELNGNQANPNGYLFDSPDLIQDISMFNLNGYLDWYLPSTTNLYSIFSLVNEFTNYPFSTNHTYYLSSDDEVVHYNYNSSQDNLGSPIIENTDMFNLTDHYRVILIRSF